MRKFECATSVPGSFSGLTDSFVQEIVSAILSSVPSVREIILFGSRADGTYRDDSDMDIYVVVEDYARDRLHTTMDCAAAVAGPARRRGLKRDVLASSVADYRKRSAAEGSLENDVSAKGMVLYAA